MIKKSEKGFKELAELIQKGMETKETLTLEISKGLRCIGSVAIKEEVCKVLDIKPWDAPFDLTASHNLETWECKVVIEYDD